MPPDTRRRLDGFLAIGPHQLDEQLQAITAFAVRREQALDRLWVALPGEDPATAAPDTGTPIVAFDDDIAGFNSEEYHAPPSLVDQAEQAVTDWHVAYATPRPKAPTTHLPVYGRRHEGETVADAILCIGLESLDRQIERLEAYAIRSSIRLQGVYIARDPARFEVLLGDFSASNRALRGGLTLSVGRDGQIVLHG